MSRLNLHKVFLVSAIWLLCSVNSFAQEDRKIERLWGCANFSPARYAEFGAQVQFSNQFLVAAYGQSMNRKVGPGVPENPYALIYTSHYYKRDYVRSGSLMIGFASPTPHSAVFSFLAGPSLNQISTNSDFKVTYSNNSYHYVTSVSSTVTERWKIGLNYKATLSFVIQNYICLNFGLAGNYNKVDNYYRFILGMGLGQFGCKKKQPTQ